MTKVLVFCRLLTCFICLTTITNTQMVRQITAQRRQQKGRLLGPLYWSCNFVKRRMVSSLCTHSPYSYQLVKRTVGSCFWSSTLIPFGEEDSGAVLCTHPPTPISRGQKSHPFVPAPHPNSRGRPIFYLLAKWMWCPPYAGYKLVGSTLGTRSRGGPRQFYHND